MAGDIKGITIEFRGNATPLQKAIRQVDSELKKTANELKGVNKALKFNPTSVDLWRQKQQLLKQRIDETTDKLSALKQQQKQMDDAKVDKNSEAYRKLQREIIECDSQLKHFKAEQRQIGSARLKAMSETFKQAGKSIEQAGQSMRGLSRAAGVAVAAIGALTVKSAEWADELTTMSKKYSIGTDQLQMYSAAAELVDVDIDTITKSHVKLEKSMYAAQDGTGAAAEAFEKLGISVTDSNGNLRSGDEVWNEAITALGSLENETERDAIAMQLMGKSAADLNPLIEDGGEAYKKLSETMSKYGLEFIDQDTLNQANEFQDSLDTIKGIGMVAFQTIGTELAAYLAPALEKVVDWVGKFAEWLTNLDPRLLAIIGAVAGLVAVLAPALIVIGKIATGIGAITSVVSVLTGAMAGLNLSMLPIIAVIAALIAIGVLLYKNWDKIKAKALEIKEKIVSTFNEIKAKVSSIFNAIKTAMLTPFNTAVNLIRTAINKIKSIINGAKLQLPKFKLPHFKIFGGKIPWGIGGAGKKPTISVEWYAQGGIFNRPTVLSGVGEAGPEAVVPLDKFWDKMDRIAAAATGPTINIYAQPGQDPRAIALEVERVLARVQKQRDMAYGI